MNYQKLAMTLLRVLGVWLLVQSIPRISAATYTIIQIANRAPIVTTSLWTVPLMGMVTLRSAIVLLFASDRVAKLIARKRDDEKRLATCSPRSRASPPAHLRLQLLPPREAVGDLGFPAGGLRSVERDRFLEVVLAGDIFGEIV
jgi:hypothetical protein